MKNKKEVAEQRTVSQDLADKEQMERDFIDELSDNELSFLESTRYDHETSVNVSQNRSGVVRTTKPVAEVGMQTEFHVGAVKPLRSGFRNFDDSIKTALALSCSNAGTTEQSRKAFQTTSEVFYGIKYELCPQNVGAEPVMKKSRKAFDYRERYSNVLPSAKIIADTKHLLAIQQERNAALAILDASDDELAITLHFDTASRKRIKGEWPSIIIRMNGRKKFRMRPRSMAVKTRENITSLLVNTLKRMSIASRTDSKELWEKIAALMTNSVAKNLLIEEQIANTLMSNHIPFHLICVSHTCEIFDKGNMFVLCEIERKIGLRELLISHIPMLRSFLS